MNKKLFFIGLFVLAIGIGTLVYGLTIERIVFRLIEQGNPVFIGIGAGLSVLGVGTCIGSIVFKRK